MHVFTVVSVKQENSYIGCFSLPFTCPPQHLALPVSYREGSLSSAGVFMISATFPVPTTEPAQVQNDCCAHTKATKDTFTLSHNVLGSKPKS